MPNETPKQLYIARFTLKSGAIFDVVTEWDEHQIHLHLLEMSKVGHIRVPGQNSKGWPVNTWIYEPVASFIIGPHEVYLADRKSPLLQ